MSLKELLESEEGKAELMDWIKEQGFKAPEEVDGLVRKKDELLAKISKLNKSQTSEKQQELLAALAEAGIEDVDTVLSAVKGKPDKPNELERQLKRLETQAQEAEKRYKEEHSRRIDAVKRAKITEALKKANVKDTAYDMAFDYFANRADVEESDGEIKIIARDAEGLGPSIDNYIAEWAKSETAKDYIVKPVNVGAGVAGSGDMDTKTVYTRADLSDPKVARKVMERKKAGESITIED